MFVFNSRKVQLCSILLSFEGHYIVNSKLVHVSFVRLHLFNLSHKIFHDLQWWAVTNYYNTIVTNYSNKLLFQYFYSNDTTVSNNFCDNSYYFFRGVKITNYKSGVLCKYCYLAETFDWLLILELQLIKNVVIELRMTQDRAIGGVPFCALEWFTHEVLVLSKTIDYLNGSSPANPVKDRRVANAVTLKNSFCVP